MKRKLNFICLVCGRVETVEVKQAIILKEIVRCYSPPKGWAILYPPRHFPARSGICDRCIAEAILDI